MGIHQKAHLILHRSKLWQVSLLIKTNIKGGKWPATTRFINEPTLVCSIIDRCYYTYESSCLIPVAHSINHLPFLLMTKSCYMYFLHKEKIPGGEIKPAGKVSSEHNLQGVIMHRLKTCIEGRNTFSLFTLSCQK